MITLLFLPAAAVFPAAAPLTTVTTSGLDIVFNSTAAPISLKNAEGDELLVGDGSSPGFALNVNSSSRNPAVVRFDTIQHLGDNSFIFGISKRAEKLGVAFGGANHYLTVEITSTEGFERFDDKSVTFELTGKENNALVGATLNYMIYDQGNVGQWQASPHHPPARTRVQTIPKQDWLGAVLPPPPFYHPYSSILLSFFFVGAQIINYFDATSFRLLHTGRGSYPNPRLLFEAPWANDSPWTSRGRFAVYVTNSPIHFVFC